MTSEKWHGYSSNAQILMIANELSRSLNALHRGDKDSAIHAWERAFELTDLTVEDQKNSLLNRELLRFREKLGEIFLSFNTDELHLLTQELIRLHPDAYNALH